MDALPSRGSLADVIIGSLPSKEAHPIQLFRAKKEVTMREDGRTPEQLRPIHIEPNFVSYPEGSILISFGNTRVLCNLSIEETIPKWLRQANRPGGWITAEYALLPRSTQTRTPRETRGLRGRSQEIRRMIGRSLRAAADLRELGERTCIVDCDVIQADGGTRTAAITGGYLALAIGLKRLIRQEILPRSVLRSPIAAISVGMQDGSALLDLSYAEDVNADVDLNVVMNRENRFIELQGTAEGEPFSGDSLDQMLVIATNGLHQIFNLQNDFLETVE